MKKINSILIVAILMISLSAFSQNEKKPKIKVTSFGTSFGFSGASTANTTEDYNNLKGAVNNPDLFIDPSTYQYSQYNYGVGGAVSPKLYLGLTPYSKKKGEYRKDRELRFSLGTSTGIRRNFNFYRYDNFTIDTLTSVNGRMVYADSMNYDRYIYTENFTELNIGVAFIFKTPLERRVHFGVGVGLEYGIAMRSTVQVENYSERGVYYYDPANPPVFNEPSNEGDYFYTEDKSDGTYSTNSTNMTGFLQFHRAYIPLSVNFRLCKKEESFFNKVYIFGEMSPGIEIQIVKNDKTYVNPYFGFAMFGFSYRW